MRTLRRPCADPALTLCWPCADPYAGPAGHVCPEGENTADFLLDTTTVDVRNEKMRVQTQAVVSKLQTVYSTSTHRQVAIEDANVQSAGYGKDVEPDGFTKESQ